MSNNSRRRGGGSSVHTSVPHPFVPFCTETLNELWWWVQHQTGRDSSTMQEKCLMNTMMQKHWSFPRCVSLKFDVIYRGDERTEWYSQLKGLQSWWCRLGKIRVLHRKSEFVKQITEYFNCVSISVQIENTTWIITSFHLPKNRTQLVCVCWGHNESLTIETNCTT